MSLAVKEMNALSKRADRVNLIKERMSLGGFSQLILTHPEIISASAFLMLRGLNTKKRSVISMLNTFQYQFTRINQSVFHIKNSTHHLMFCMV